MGRKHEYIYLEGTEPLYNTFDMFHKDVKALALIVKAEILSRMGRHEEALGLVERAEKVLEEVERLGLPEDDPFSDIDV